VKNKMMKARPSSPAAPEAIAAQPAVDDEKLFASISVPSVRLVHQ
jgi:hypothetical protein